MTRAATQAERWDRARDHLKHDTRPADAALKVAVLRSEALQNFYSAERRAGTDPLTANERLHEFAKRLDAQSPFEVEQEAVRKIMMGS